MILSLIINVGRIILKKILLSGFCVFMAACSSKMYTEECGCKEQMVYYDNETEYVEECVETSAQCPCGNSEETVENDPCKCAYEQPLREVLRPRIKVMVQENNSRRKCPEDTQVINCGCGDCQVKLQNDETINVQEVIPAMPEAYELASSRIFSRFIKDTEKIYKAKDNVLLYVKSAEAKSEDLPEGVQEGVKLFKDKLLTSYTYAVTDDEKNHDYYIQTTADWFDTVSKTVPAIVYTVTLYDKNGIIIDTWVEIVKKAENSETWL